MGNGGEPDEKKRRLEDPVGKTARLMDAGDKPKTGITGGWKRVESKSNPGKFYYFNAASGESTESKPPGYLEPRVTWERKESKSAPGEFYYYNRETGASQVDRPAGEVTNDVPIRSKALPKE